MKLGIRKCASLMAAAMVVAAGWQSSAKASLQMIIEATTLNGQAVADAHNVTVAHTGDVIAYQVYATISGGTSGTDSVTSVNGDVLSAGAAILGTITHTVNDGTMVATNSGVTASFRSGTWNNGTQTAGNDLDSDTDNDVGSVLSSGRPLDAATGVIQYIAASAVGGNRILLGNGTFTVSSISAGSTTIEFLTANVNGLNHNPIWVENSTSFTQSTGIVNTAINGIVVTSSQTVPEPASLGVMALGGLALFARRRKTA
jgi:hypothetical protein